jgi:hypothetical protein
MLKYDVNVEVLEQTSEALCGNGSATGIQTIGSHTSLHLTRVFSSVPSQIGLPFAPLCCAVCLIIDQC